jgi:phytanoyl-CoA hydroxylase
MDGFNENCQSFKFFDMTAASFQAQGYAVIPDFLSPQETRLLRARMSEVIQPMDLVHLKQASKAFTTKEQDRSSDEYFLTSGDKVRPFFEDCAELEINKIGHALHVLDPVFRDQIMSPQVEHVLRDVAGMESGAVPVQSMYILKSARLGGEVTPHQDSTFLVSEPFSCVGLWFALQDADETNGCLWAVPGSHITQPVSKLFLREKGGGTVFEGDINSTLSCQGAVPLPTKAGTLVVLHGALVHLSYANTSGRSRHAYSVHFISNQAKWHPRNWLQAHSLFLPLYYQHPASPRIPVLDLSNHNNCPEALAGMFDMFMRQFGMVVLVNHNVDLPRDLITAFMDFFHQPENDKLAWSAKSYGEDGYMPFQRENVAGSRGSAVDPVESLYYSAGRVLRPVNDDVVVARNKGLAKYVQDMQHLSTRVYRLAAMALGLQDLDAFAKLGSDDFIKISHYYCLSSSQQEKVLYGAHTDYTGFTFLSPDSAEHASSELQVLVRGQKQWTSVPTVPQGIVCNAGDFFPLWSGGRWVSPVHRVVAVPSSQRASERLSIPYFTGPSPQAVIRNLVSFPRFGEADKTSKEVIIAGKWLDAKRNRSNV